MSLPAIRLNRKLLSEKFEFELPRKLRTPIIATINFNMIHCRKQQKPTVVVKIKLFENEFYG